MSFPEVLGLAARNTLGKRVCMLAGLATMALQPSAAAGDPLFAPPVFYSTGKAPFSVAIGDLNGDGKPDLAVANAFGSSVSVLLGHGDGSFGARTDFEAGLGSHSVAIGDLNDDGKPDLAVAKCVAGNGAATVSVLWGAGDGTFPRCSVYPAGYTPTTASIGDLNGDHKPDLAVVNYGDPQNPGSLSVLLGDGQGSFGTKTDYQTGAYPNSVGIGDLNGDGRSELVVGNYGESTVSLLLGAHEGGFGVTGFDMGINPYSLALDDLNGDGKPDLVTANLVYYGVDGLSVRLGNGDGTFGAESRFGTGTYPQFVGIGDLNGDSKPDLAAVNQGYYQDDPGSVSVLLGKGDGSFEDKVDYSAGPHPGSLAIGDLDGDGRADLAITNNYSDTLSVLLNIGGTALDPIAPKTLPLTLGPNPGRSLKATFTLPDARPATLAVYDVAGREVARREVGHLGAGVHEISVAAERDLTPGVYVVHLIQGDRRSVARMVIIR